MKDDDDPERDAIKAETRRGDRPLPPPIPLHRAGAKSLSKRPDGRRALPSAAERVQARIGAGPLVHVPTGIKTLDEITRGGLLVGRLAVFGGAPDAGKTSLAVQIAHHAARNGFAVAIHCVDEDHEGIECRIGQSWGLSLEELERRDRGSLSFLVDRLKEVPNLLILDQEEDDLTIEDTADELVKLGSGEGCRGLVLVIDSLQTARTRTMHTLEGKERADLVTATAKAIGRRTGALVILTSELSRGAYRSRNPAERTEPMAAFKESGSIEYAMTIGLVLNNVAGEANLIHVDVPKNKRGERGVAFQLRRSPQRCTYEDAGRVKDELDADAPAPNAEERKEQARLVLQGHPGIAGIGAWIRLMGGSRTSAMKACQALMDADEVENKGTPKEPEFHWRDPSV